VKIFISWSGDASREMALLLREWIGRVLQYADPFVSSKDIAKGAQWLVTISEELADTAEGIVCVTPTNSQAPWLNYEAGALAKTTGQTSVRTVLLGLKPRDLPSGAPLSNFQHTNAVEKEEMFSLVESIHIRSGRTSVPLNKVQWAFEQAWPELETALKAIDLNQDTAPPQVEERDEKTLLQDVLREVKDISISLARLSEGTIDNKSFVEERPPRLNDARFVEQIQIGDVLEHEAFGKGEVISVMGSGQKKVAEVRFQEGRKRLLLRHAPVTYAAALS
jgi:hypothetical protein